ncbi:hypothetical protein [Sporisorium scitamineum]|uniref:Uncharacterized protein n=1 Tax=Sporisorium scitamineum TaxID=49012 RepID=A0A0F7RVX0_9BASI|nr:hypothetical protein [Sporisorium scitamineum]
MRISELPLRVGLTTTPHKRNAQRRLLAKVESYWLG